MTKAETLLQQKSIRITPMRQLLLEYFFEKQPIIGLAELEQDFPKADRITLYRTLKTFEEKGILHFVEDGHAEVKYALCKEHCTEKLHQDQHPHFHCQQCGEVYCLDTIFIPELPLPEGYMAKEVKMTIRGVCQECGEKGGGY